MPILYPLINGLRFDYSTAEINIDGLVMNGIKEISYKHSLDPGELRGTRAQVIGRTRGKYGAEGSASFYKLEFQELIRRLALKNGGSGYMEASFDVTVNYQPSPTSPDIVTDVLLGCRIKSAENSHSEGEEALVVRCDLHIMRLVESGVEALDPRQLVK
jgi:hypothetical protein